MPTAPGLGRIERYILRELAIPFVLTFAVACFLFLSGEFLREVINKWLNRGMSPVLALQAMWFLLPPLLIFTLPMALLLSVLVTFGRLSEDHEIVAMQAAGVPWHRLFGPVLVIGLAASLFNFWLASDIIPRTRLESRNFIVKTMLANPTLLLEAQVWLPEVWNMNVWIGEIDDETGILRDLRIYRDDDAGRTQSITAARGQIHIMPSGTDVVLELHDGTMHRADPNDPEVYDLLKFKTIRIPFPVSSLIRWAERRSTNLKNSEKTLRHVLRDLEDARKAGRPTRRLWREVGERTAMPFACLTFVLVGVPLGIRPHKSIRGYGAIVCVVLVLVFYLLYSVGQVLARQDVLHPLLSLWLPNAFLGGAGFVATVRLWRR